MKQKKELVRILAFAIFCCCSISLWGCSTTENETEINPPATIVQKHGKLKVEGTALLNQHGDTVQLRGVSLGWHNWWPRFYAAQTVAWLVSDWHIDIIRAAIGVEPGGNPAGYLYDPQFAFDCLYAVIDEAIEQGIYVIVDWHSHNIKTKEAEQFFLQVATKYPNTPNIIYEIFNEPLDNIPWQDVKDYSASVIRTIRSYAPDNLILVGSPHWDQDLHLVAADPLTGFTNIAYTLHFYAATHKQYLRDRAELALSKNIPVFVSECAAMEASGDGALNMDEWNKWVAWMNQHHISWAAWSVTDKSESCSMLRPSDTPGSEPVPLSGWTDADLQEWGKTVRDYLTANQLSL